MQSKFRFKRVLEKVPEKVGDGEALVQSGSTGFRRRFRRKVPEQVPENVPEKGSGEGLGGFGAKPSQVQQGSGEGSGGRSGTKSWKIDYFCCWGYHRNLFFNTENYEKRMGF